MVRACRLVVDTGNIDIISQFKIRYTSGIHAFGWSKEEAIDYMVKNTAMPRSSIEAEVLRYITLPGQALTYAIGEMKILELREDFKIKKRVKRVTSYKKVGWVGPKNHISRRNE